MYALQCAANPEYHTPPRRTIREALEDLTALSSAPCPAPHLVVEVDETNGRVAAVLRVDVLTTAILSDPDSTASRREQLQAAVDVLARQLEAE